MINNCVGIVCFVILPNVFRKYIIEDLCDWCVQLNFHNTSISRSVFQAVKVTDWTINIRLSMNFEWMFTTTIIGKAKTILHHTQIRYFRVKLNFFSCEFFNRIELNCCLLCLGIFFSLLCNMHIVRIESTRNERKILIGTKYVHNNVGKGQPGKAIEIFQLSLWTLAAYIAIIALQLYLIHYKKKQQEIDANFFFVVLCWQSFMLRKVPRNRTVSFCSICHLPHNNLLNLLINSKKKKFVGGWMLEPKNDQAFFVDQKTIRIHL